MANKLVKNGVARVETFGGLVQKTVGSLIGSERLQERGQNHLEHAEALRSDGAATATAVEPEAPAESTAQAPKANKPKKTQANAQAQAQTKAAAKVQAQQDSDSAAQTAQDSEGGHPPSLHPKTTPRRQYSL